MAVAQAFETEIHIGLPVADPTKPILIGGITEVTATEGGKVQNVLKASETWDITVKWYLAGTYLELNDPIPGTWDANVYLEGMGGGGGKEHNLGPAPAPNVDQTKTMEVDDLTDPNNKVTINQWAYEAKIPVQANSLKAGVYKMVAALTYTEQDGTPGPMAGFLEGGWLQVYND